MAQPKKKMSIFAQKMQAMREPKEVTQDVLPRRDFGKKSYIATGPDAEAIHHENTQKLMSMSEEEIKREREELMASVSPALIQTLRALRKDQTAEVRPMDVTESSEDQNSEMTVDEDTVKELVNKYPHMDVVEPEKLQWIGQLPSVEQVPSDPYPARFNFDGDLLPFKDDGGGVLKGLHNHGEEQERPGYTLQELIQLTRSAVLQQRVIALNSLAKIMANASRYNDCFQSPILPALLDADMYFLLRFSLDDPALPVVMASAGALCNLIVNHDDELCLDVMMGTPLGLQQPSLGLILDLKKEEIDELKDREILKLDLIRGTFRTNLLERFKYILTSLPAEPVEKKHVLKTLTRIARHSYESAQSIFFMPGLLTQVRDLLDRSEGSFYPEALKLFRVISARSSSFAAQIITQYTILDPVFRCISGEKTLGHPEAVLLSLEGFYLWQTFLSYNLTTETTETMSPVLGKLLIAHINTTSMESCTSDIEHGAALMSTLSTAAKMNYKSVAFAFPLVIQAADKWISQYLLIDEPTFSMSKLVGSVLQMLTGCASHIGHETALTPLLTGRLKPTYEPSFKRLRSCSWLINGKLVTSPDNLPCLGSISPTVKKESPLPFLFSLGSCLLALGNKSLIESFIFGNDQMLRYIKDVLTDTSQALCRHWYARQELNFLIILVQLYTIIESELQLDKVLDYQNLFYQLAFTLLTSVQKGDKHLLAGIMSNTIFNARFFSLDMSCVSNKFEELKLGGVANLSSKNEVLTTALNELPQIELCYAKETGLGGVSMPWPPVTLTGILNATETALPLDWFFLPIMRIHGLEGRDPNAAEVVTRALQWFIILEEFVPQFTSSVEVSAKYCRLSCVFLSGNDLFRDLTPLLRVALSYITVKTDHIDFNKSIPGLTSFYDFYRELLEQFTGVSYCDPVFGQYVLVPLAQKHDPKYKKIVLSELAAVLRLLSTPISDVEMQHYFSPLENDPDVLMTYLRLLATGVLRATWCPVLHEVALHHVTSYVSTKCDKMSKTLLDRIHKLGNEEVKALLLLRIQTC